MDTEGRSECGRDGGVGGQQLSVLVVGGSVGGLSCAHALLRAGCRVQVFEKARAIAPLGAGLALDEVECCPALREWGLGDALRRYAIPLAVEENRLVDEQSKALHCLAVNPLHNCKAMHWSDLHKILYDALPTGIVRWANEVIAFQEIENGSKVKVLVRQDGNTTPLEFQGDLLVAADGCNSRIRSYFLPDDKRRYSGYCAWRGVVNKSDESSKDVMIAMRERYPDIGNTVYVEMTRESHSAVFEIPGGRLNWLWYVNQPEPVFKGVSLTSRGEDDAIAKMIEEANEVLTPEMTMLLRTTKAPFLQAICDREPLKRMVWGRVVLLGEAAHPTTPHAARSTNMSIMDAVTLGHCISSSSNSTTTVASLNKPLRSQSIFAALAEYESLRLPATTQQLLFSRYLGLLKQGHLHPSGFSWLQASPIECEKLVQAHWNTFDTSIFDKLPIQCRCL